jgi:hypothetical protein
MASMKTDYAPGWWGSFHSIAHEYTKLRDAGWRATDAMRAARIRERFSRLEAQGRVQLLCEYDEGPYQHGDLEDEDETNARIDSEGLYGLVALAVGPEERAEVVDSIWGFIGYDWQNSGYDTDLMLAACELAELRGCAVEVSTCTGKAA